MPFIWYFFLSYRKKLKVKASFKVNMVSQVTCKWWWRKFVLDCHFKIAGILPMFTLALISAIFCFYSKNGAYVLSWMLMIKILYNHDETAYCFFYKAMWLFANTWRPSSSFLTINNYVILILHMHTLGILCRHPSYRIMFWLAFNITDRFMPSPLLFMVG